MAKGRTVLLGSILGLGALGGGIYIIATRGNVEAKVTDLTLTPAEAKPRDNLSAKITWTNTGKLYTFAVIVWVGDPATMSGWGGILPEVRPIPRMEQQSTIQVTVPENVATGKYDVSAIICDATVSSEGLYTITKTYAMITKQGLLTITGGVPPPPDEAVVSTFVMAKA